MGKVQNLLIGLAVIAFVIVGFVYFIANTGAGTGKTYTNINSSAYNKLSEINQLSNDITTTSNQTAEPTTFDILGSYLKQGYISMKLTLITLPLISAMTTQAGQDVGLDDGSNMFIPMILTILGILIIIGVIIYGLTGKDL